MKYFTAEVTGFAPSSAIQFSLFDGHEIIFSSLIPAQLVGQLRPKKPNAANFTPNQASQIVERHHGGQSLRELAAEFGVSHETIRTIIKQQQTLKSQYLVSKPVQKGEI
ncbi:MAG: hypothetical protein J0H83_16865 [Candidatus Melainabacteria bacterium]|nr:hypothetical protein [Candidatus Melainabacteria bacterium]